MSLPICNNHTSSLPPKTLSNPSRVISFFFPRPLPRTLLSLNPKAPTKLILLRPPSAANADTQTLPQSAIKRIADKLRSLGYVEEDSEETLETDTKCQSPGEIFIPLPKHLSNYRVGHTMDTSWSTPHNPVPEPGAGKAIQRFHELKREVRKEKEEERKKGERGERVPTLAELTLSNKELRRLRAIGIQLRKKLKVGKAGITEGIVNGIHERWRNSEVVKIVCEDICRLNMKRTHDLLERKTGGLVIWRSGSNILLYRGAEYKFPYFFSDNTLAKENSVGTSTSSTQDCGLHIGDESCLPGRDGIDSAISNTHNKMAQQPPLIQGVGHPNRVRFQLPGEVQLAEEADRLLDGLGPRFTDWWGYDPLPVDADLLPAVVPGYRKPFRLLPYGVKPKLTNDEMTTLKRLGRPLPCHFVLGRNRKLQGLAASIVKLWEKCEIAKIAIKRGVQNTNSEIMAEELKWLTGGTLLSRDREFIVFYRGKDFLPAVVSSAIEGRRKCAIPLEKQRIGHSSSDMITPKSEPGIVYSKCEDEYDGIKEQERNLIPEDMKPGTTEALIEKTSSKLQMALEKKARAEKLLADLEKEEIIQEVDEDKEGITEEERYMLRKVGLRMNPFLLLGRRKVFDGTIENMHLHWKYRELVKVICGGRSIQEVHEISRTLEAESGGILVAVERVRKGYAIIVYRGKNYKRPASLRPQTLLNKREAMKRSIEAQRRESLKLHVLKLSSNIDELRLKLDKDPETNKKHSAKSSDFQMVGERSGADSSLFNTNDKIDHCKISESEIEGTDTQVSMNSQGGEAESATHSDDKIDHCEISESEIEETDTQISMNGQGGEAESATHSYDTRGTVPYAELPRGGMEMSVHSSMQNIPNQGLLRPAQLSNKDRLILRKQALMMKKRPVLAVGRSNIVTGVAKAIKQHFQKYPLAIVNVKGRAKGTSVQEVVFKLEQATGAVLVSQEPSKVILYRGWGAEKQLGRTVEKNKKDAKETSPSREHNVGPVISPELLSAIRLECGLQGTQEEEQTL
ncbi:hypothetical protein NMG60_11006550 [Bertholletia excelsa]